MRIDWYETNIYSNVLQCSYLKTKVISAEHENSTNMFMLCGITFSDSTGCGGRIKSVTVSNMQNYYSNRFVMDIARGEFGSRYAKIYSLAAAI